MVWGLYILISMRKRILNMSLDSWTEAIEYAKSEVERTGKRAIVAEYKEQLSVDGMLFYEVGDIEHIDQLGNVYVITRIEYVD